MLFADYMLDGLVCGAAADANANALSIEPLESIGVEVD